MHTDAVRSFYESDPHLSVLPAAGSGNRGRNVAKSPFANNKPLDPGTTSYKCNKKCQTTESLIRFTNIYYHFRPS